MNTLLTGVGLLVFYFVWTKIWQPILLIKTRDTLFDIRNNAREWFLENGYGLEHPIYLELRKMLNSHIHHTKSINLFTYIVVMHHQSESLINIKRDIDNLFHTKDTVLNAYVTVARDNATVAILFQMLFTNFFLAVLTTMACLGHAIYLFCKILYTLPQLIITKGIRKLGDFGSSSSFSKAFASAICIGILSLPFISSTRVEAYISKTPTTNTNPLNV